MRMALVVELPGYKLLFPTIRFSLIETESDNSGRQNAGAVPCIRQLSSQHGLIDLDRQANSHAGSEIGILIIYILIKGTRTPDKTSLIRVFFVFRQTRVWSRNALSGDRNLTTRTNQQIRVFSTLPTGRFDVE